MTELQFRYIGMMLWLIAAVVSESCISIGASAISMAFAVATIRTVWRERNK